MLRPLICRPPGKVCAPGLRLKETDEPSLGLKPGAFIMLRKL